jgi:hypothetical protein
MRSRKRFARGMKPWLPECLREKSTIRSEKVPG